MRLQYFSETAIFIPDEKLIRSDHEKNGGDFPFWAKVWSSAIAMADYLRGHPSIIKDKQVLELAAGLGLPSVVAAASAASVTCTDIFPEPLAFVEASAHYNRLDNITCSIADIRNIPAQLTPDIVLLSDVNYDAGLFSSLNKTIHDFLQRGAGILLATPQRIVARPFISELLPYCVHQDERMVGDEIIHLYLMHGSKPSVIQG